VSRRGMPTQRALHAAGHRHPGRHQDLQGRTSGSEDCRPPDRQGRDLRASWPKRRRQDHADLHHLRHRHAVDRYGHRRRPRHSERLPPGAHEDRPRAARADHRRLRDGAGDGHLQPGPVRPCAQPGLRRESAARPQPVGEAQRQDHDPVRRHEAPRHDRQGAQPRTGHSLPRRAHRRRRRRAAPRHVGAGSPTARERA
jgi:hypothetical protein